MAIGWVTSEGLAVDDDGDVLDLTIRSFGRAPRRRRAPDRGPHRGRRRASRSRRATPCSRRWRPRCGSTRARRRRGPPAYCSRHEHPRSVPTRPSSAPATGWSCRARSGSTTDGLADGFGPSSDAALDNLRRLVEVGGRDALDQVTKTTVFLVDMGDYDELNAIYTGYFDRMPAGTVPARSAVAVAALPLGALVEVEAWVHVGRPDD